MATQRSPRGLLRHIVLMKAIVPVTRHLHADREASMILVRKPQGHCSVHIRAVARLMCES